MDFTKLAKIAEKVKDSSVNDPDAFNFGSTFRGVKFEEAIKSKRFKSWVKYIISIESEWTVAQEDDMENFKEFLDKKTEALGGLTGDIEKQLEFLEEIELNKVPPTFKAGKYRGKPLDEVPYDHKVWFVSKTLREHPPTDKEFWEGTMKGRQLWRLIDACKLIE